MEIITLTEAGSTNTELASRAASLPHGTVLSALSQTAGRGQRGNSWEAERGKNLTFSLLLKPEGLDASRQFEISEAVALGITTVLRRRLPDADITVKWPNDIYAGDLKICGILIENVVSGRTLTRSIAGIGINVNQREFRSDAPNPVSMRQIAGHDFDLDPLLREVVTEILSLLGTDLHRRYLDSLYRRRGVWPFRDMLRDTEIQASIESVAPTGTLQLRDSAGQLHEYAFKEVAFII